PDVVLRVIFSELTFLEQIKNLRVWTTLNASAWMQSQMGLFKTHTTLNILVGHDAISCIINSSFEPFYKEESAIEHERKEINLNALTNEIDVMSDESVHWLLDILPNITRLRIAFAIATTYFADRISLLLRSNWSATLESLELYVKQGPMVQHQNRAHTVNMHLYATKCKKLHCDELATCSLS